MSPLEQVQEVLRDHGMPDRLLPDDVVDGGYDADTGRFHVVLSKPSERTIEGIPVRYAQTIAGLIRQGTITELEGVRAKRLMWVRVDTIHDHGEKLSFHVGPVSQRLGRANFQ